MNEEKWRTVELYGGAFTIEVPTRFYDISEYRDVPNHQEVYADTDRDQSIVVEINKHVDKPDAESTAFFWTDLMSIQDAENPKLERTGTLTAADLPNLDFNTVSYVGWSDGRGGVSKGREEATNTLRVYIASFRMPKVKSDILVIFNIPEKFSEESSVAGLPVQQGEAADAMIMRIVKSFTIKSLGIFGGK